MAHEADLPGDDVALPARDLAVGLRQLLPGHLDREAWLQRGQPALVFSLGGLVLADVVAVAPEQQSAHRCLLPGDLLPQGVPVVGDVGTTRGVCDEAASRRRRVSGAARATGD